LKFVIHSHKVFDPVDYSLRQDVCLIFDALIRSNLQGVHKVWVHWGFYHLFYLFSFFPPHRFIYLNDEQVTGETYLNMLRDKLMPQIECLGEGLPHWFQQDGAPAHFAAAVRNWLNDTFPHWIRRGHVEWSPRSLGLSPLDFFFWGMLKEKVCSMKIINLNHMKERITSQCAEVDGNADLFRRVHLNFAKRIQLCSENDGNDVENIIYRH